MRPHDASGAATTEMNVLHIVPSMAPEYGGPVAVVRALTSALTREGIRCDIFSTVQRRAGADIRVAAGPDVHLFETGPLARFWPAYSNDLTKAVRAGIQSGTVDLVHVHEPWHHPGLVAFRRAFEYGVPCVLTPHGTLEAWALEHKALKKRVYMRIFQDHVIRSSDAIHALTNEEMKRITDLGYETPIFVTPNGVDPDLLESAPDAGELTAKYPQLEGKLVILFLGRLHAKKGLDVLARSFARISHSHRDCMLLVAGPDQDGSKERMESILLAEHVLDRTVFTGMLSGRDKLAALKRADMFVLSSYSEGFSVAVLEALAAGLPVVISRQCNFPEVSKHAAGFVVEPEEAAVTQAIATLLADARSRVAMGRNGRRLVRERYTWTAIAASMAERYRRLIVARRGTRPS